MDKKAKLTFKNLFISYGYSEKVADELWKWYNFSEKKGVASSKVQTAVPNHFLD